MKFSIYMIVKNEEACIEKALQSTKGVDELIVCDTGSTDRTIEIAKKYTDKVYTDYVWNDDFAEAKNHACSKCTGDWVMSLDADCYLEEGFLDKVKEIIAKANGKSFNTWLVDSGSENTKHIRAKIYKNDGTVFYNGKAHENLNIEGISIEPIPKVYYGYSENHFKDPDRYIRCLNKDIAKYPLVARWKFYLAREYYYRKDYKVAIHIFEEYLKLSKFPDEKAEALFMMAEIYWWTGEGDKAREMCGKAILINPDNRKALSLMAEMHYEPNKSKWSKLAQLAENKDVMFKK